MYDINKTKQNEAIGTVYGSDKLIDNKTGKEGFIGVDLLKEITLDISGIKEKELGLTIKANPIISLSKKVTIKDTSIATYNSITNRIQAHKRGKTELTVSLPVGNNTMILSSTINVINSNIPITRVTLDRSLLTLNLNQSTNLKATINPSDTTDSKALTWTTSNSKVATVDSNGKVTGISEGEATITVRTSNGKTASCEVTVIEQEPELVYQAHVADYGWLETVGDGETAGTTGKNKQMEAIKINLINNVYKGTVEYSAHVADYGWMAWTDNGNQAGTTGENKQMEAIKIKLTGELEEKYDIYYRVHAEELGWLDWTLNGKAAGTAGYCYQIEAIEIKLVEKGSRAPGATERAYVQKRYIKYASHVADYGWLSDVYDGSISGTIGKCKQMEAISISLENQPYGGNIEYRTHSADIGWQEFRSNGTVAGTVGRNKQMEAIEIKLTGEMEKEYDIYYRVHIADYGWLDWAKNGASAGSEGMSKRIEAIEIRIVQKGGSEPGNTVRPFIKK